MHSHGLGRREYRSSRGWRAPKNKLLVAALIASLSTLVQPQARFAYGVRRDGRILDVGCGDFARIDRYVGKRRADIEIVGIDLYEDATIYGSLASVAIPKRDRAYSRLACDLEKDPFPFPDGFFDGVYFSHVIEHLAEKRNALNEICRVLRRGGLLYVETPGPMARVALRPPWLTPEHGGTIRYDDDPTHLGEPMSPSALVDVLRSSGLTVEQSGPVRELGLLGTPLYLAMMIAGALPFVPSRLSSPLYGAGTRNLVGWGIYALARR